MPFATAADLASMRVILNSALDTTCAVQRLSGNTYVVITPSVACLIYPGSGTVTYPGLPSILALQAWDIALPWDADVLVGDHIVTALATYSVQRVEQPSSYNIDTLLHCYQLSDAAGSPVYLVPNATINLVRRSGASVYSGRRVRLEWPASTDPIQPSGGRIAGYLYDVPNAVYTLLDIVTITQEDGFTGVQSPAQYSVDLAQFLIDGPPLVRVHIVGENR